MKAFAYVNAANEKEAVAALGTERGAVMPIAGGMDLLGLMKDYIAQPDRLVNVKNLDRTIRKSSDGGLRIGAAVTLGELASHADAAKLYPALVHAAAEVGTPQIRNAGTVGGNLNQRPRCWYFRNEEFNCLKKGGSRCFAVDGENQFHAIFGGGPCHIVHPSSLAVPAIALDAKFRIVGPTGEREVAAADYYQMPDRNLLRRNRARSERAADPRHPAGSGRRAQRDLRDPLQAIARLAARVRLGRALDERPAIRGARVVMGAVAPVPWRSAGGGSGADRQADVGTGCHGGR